MNLAIDKFDRGMVSLCIMLGRVEKVGHMITAAYIAGDGETAKMREKKVGE